MSTIQTAAPVIPFHESRTYRCLQEALQDKRRAQRFYQSAVCLLEENSLQVIAHAFRFTAAQEAEHAAVLEGLLTSNGENIPVPAEAAPLPCTPLEMLRAAAAAEHTVWDERCPLCASAARAEGYPRIAAAMERIAETDQRHARRFVQYMQALADRSLFRDERRVSWVCLACGQLHTDCEPPALCSGCSAAQGHFIRTSFYPFAVEG